MKYIPKKWHTCPDCVGEGLHIGPIYENGTFYGMAWFSCVWCELGLVDNETLNQYHKAKSKKHSITEIVHMRRTPAPIASHLN